MEKMEFKAESKRLLDLMVNSIYTHREIFLREIVSNASDAIDKLCFISLTDDRVGMSRDDFRIKISADEENRIITVSDNGIGMTRQELEENLGVIARSGSDDFKRAMADSKDPDSGLENNGIDIIGQFGVGFYSAFMVSDLVKVITKAYGSDKAYKWESAGADGFTIEECEKDTVGTDVIMCIKEDSEDEDYSTFLRPYRLRSLIKKYSDYIGWPIVMDTEQSVEDGEEEETIIVEETVNSMVPIWQRSKNDAPDEDCIAFYKEKYFDMTDPVRVIRVSAEGTVSYKALLFIPESAPYDFYTRDFKPGLQLYSNGVMIMENCADILPDFYRFVRGVVDSPDLSLNISREMLQHDRQLRVISSNVEKKVTSELGKLLEEDPDKYGKFYDSFGLTLKYGVIADFGAKKDVLSGLIMFRSAELGKNITLAEYAKNMPEGQEYIYYAVADTVERALALPQTEQVRLRGFDILCMTQDVDEFVVQALGTFEEKEFRGVNSGDLGLESEEEREAVEKKADELSGLLEFAKETLGERVDSVKLSHKLVSHAVCLSTEGDISLEMEKYFASLPDGRGMNVKAKRVLELNGDHPAVEALSAAYSDDKERAVKLVEILHAQALLMAGINLDDPSAYSELVLGLF